MRFTILASDYDGTIATHGVVSQSTVAALRKFGEAGGELVLVTGREVVDLQSIFPELTFSTGLWPKTALSFSIL